MKLSAQVALCFALLPFASQALPAAGSASASSKDAAASKPDQQASNSQQQAAAADNNTNDNNQNAQQDAPPAVNENHKPSDQQILNAVMSWMNDTGKVTNFLNTAASFSGEEFTKEATIALNAEVDELNHKKVLDDALLAQDPNVQAANDVLATQGTFQKVVDVLQSMVDNGPDNAQAQVDEINQNRCVNVLPNIDQYFVAAGQADVSAVRPTGCLEITATVSGGVQAEATSQSASAADSVSAAEVTESSSSQGVEASSSRGQAMGTGSKNAEAAEKTASASARNGNSGQNGSGNKGGNEEDDAEDDE